MSTSAQAVRFEDASLVVDLADGRTLSVPLAWFPRLLAAMPEQRERVRISRKGLHWHELDEDVSVAGLLAGPASDPRPPIPHAEVMARDPDRCPTHPGELLREDVLPAVKQPKTRIAQGLGISRQHLHDILAERKPVSAEVAVKLAKMFGSSAEVWIRMQGSYDIWHAARSVDVSGVPTLAAAG